MKRTIATLAAVGAIIGLAGAAQARDQIKIVGSSTVYPFTTAVAEQFAKSTGAPAPVVESTGTGGGMKLFCAGVGDEHPDATNASRRIKKSEFETCQKNGVTDIGEVTIGFDGLTLAHAKGGADVSLTLTQLFLALAKQVPDKDGNLIANPNKLWSDIDAALPSTKIEILGPPPTSGTRDSMHELFMEKGAEGIEALKALKEKDAKAFEAVWKTVREDGAYIEAGENDNVIVQKLEANPDAFGVFGFSFLEENDSKIAGVALDGVAPSFEAIAAGDYKGARNLYIYIKKAHVGVVPNLDKFATEYVSDAALGEDGYLAEKGLVPLPPEALAKVKETVASMTAMDGSELK